MSNSATRSAIDVFDRDLLRLRRERAAGNIHEFDFLLKDVAGRLAERLDLIRRAFPLVLDLGAHHGVLADILKRREGTEKVFSSDLSFSMAEKISAAAVVADEEFLPFARGSLDAVISNLSLQWVNDLPGTLLQVKNALKADGLFMAALPGGETLKELRQCLMEAEVAVTGGASPRVSPFIDMRDMGGLMQRAGFALPVIDSDRIVVDYTHPLILMRDLRGMGASNGTYNRLMIPTRRQVLLEAARLYQEKFGDASGRVPATFEIIYAIGWAPHAGQQKPLKPGSASARLADALKSEEIGADEKARP